MLPQMQRLRARMVDWSSDTVEWIQNFHAQLDLYSGIYATDIYERASSQSVRFTSYLRQQFVARLARLRREASVGELRYSSPVYAAIQRTAWRPNRTLWGGYRLGESSQPVSGGLEVVRILIRPAQVGSVEEYNCWRVWTSTTVCSRFLCSFWILSN